MSKKTKVTDKEKIHFLLDSLNETVEEDKENNSLYVPNREFYFNKQDELIKIKDYTEGKTYTD